MVRCVIVGGADISNYGRVTAELRHDDFLIYCDSGLKHLPMLKKAPSLIIGDFDSHENPKLPVETIVLPCVKDDTDTMYALKEAIKRGFEEFLLVGVIGQRFDHSLGNIAALNMLDSLGLDGKIIDDYSEMQIVSGRAEVDSRFSYFSLLNVTGEAKGIDIVNAKYEISDAEIGCCDPYGISNEPLPGKTAVITVRAGRLLLIKVY